MGKEFFRFFPCLIEIGSVICLFQLVGSQGDFIELGILVPIEIEVIGEACKLGFAFVISQYWIFITCLLMITAKFANTYF